MHLTTIDFETGGFDWEKCGVTQIAISALDIDTLQSVDQYVSHVKPYGNKRYEDDALKGTRLTLEFLEANGKDPKQVVQESEAFLQKYTPKKGFKDKPIFIGQNPLFDIGFANVFLKEFSKNTLEKYYTGKWFGDYYIPTHADTVVMAKLMYGSRLPDYKLGTILEKAGIELTDAHDAMNDVKGTESFIVLGTQKLRMKGNSSSSQSSEEATGHRFRTTFEIA